MEGEEGAGSYMALSCMMHMRRAGESCSNWWHIVVLGSVPVFFFYGNINDSLFGSFFSSTFKKKNG